MRLFSSKKRFFKVIQKCSESNDTGVIVVCSKSGDDLKDLLINKKDKEIIEKILSHYCNKCNIIVEDINKKDIKSAKKVFTYKEI